MQSKFFCGFVISWLVFGVAVSVSAQETTQSEKENVVVFPFDDTTGKNLSLAVTDMVVSRVVNLGRFKVVEREKLDKIIAEQRLALSGLLDESTAVKVGQLIGAKKAIAGSVVNYDAGKDKKEDWHCNISLVVKLIDIETAELLKASDVKGFGDGKTELGAQRKAIESAMFGVEQDIRRMFALKLKIANISKDTIYINAGNNLGLKEGYKFNVIHRGQPITDTDGKVLEIPKEKVATLRITEVMGSTSKAKIVSKKGMVAPGDPVEEWITANIRAYLSIGYVPYNMAASTASLTWDDTFDQYDLGFTQKAVTNSLAFYFAAETEPSPWSGGIKGGFILGGDKVHAFEGSLYGKGELTGSILSAGAGCELTGTYAWGVLGSIGKGNNSGANFALGPNREKIMAGTAVETWNFTLGITPTAYLRLNFSETFGMNIGAGYRLFLPIEQTNWKIITKDENGKEVTLENKGLKTESLPGRLDLSGPTFDVSCVWLF